MNLTTIILSTVKFYEGKESRIRCEKEGQVEWAFILNTEPGKLSLGRGNGNEVGAGQMENLGSERFRRRVWHLKALWHLGEKARRNVGLD